MAIDKLKRKNGQVYRVRVSLPSGKRISQCFDRKVDAEKFELEIKSGLRPVQQVERISFAQLCEKYETLHLSLQEFATRQRYGSVIRKYLKPRFGDAYIDQITKMEVSIYRAELHKLKLSDSTKNFIFVALQSILKKAVEWELLGKSPTVGVKPPRKGQPRTEYWSESEVSKFLHYHRESPRFVLYMLAVNTGMRLGECPWGCGPTV